MQARVIAPVDLAPLDAELLDDSGRMRLLPAARLLALGADPLAAWANRRARYGLVTEELIRFLRTDVLDGRHASAPAEALEIGAGMGDLGRHLGVHMTDSASQTTPEMRLYYAELGQPVIDPPPDVERLDAIAAVTRYRPRVVIASWCTQLYRDGDTPRGIGSSIVGIDEEWILDRDGVEAYVHIGNVSPHGTKRINVREHTTLRARWIVSRAFDQDKNLIQIWRRK